MSDDEKPAPLGRPQWLEIPEHLRLLGEGPLTPEAREAILEKYRAWMRTVPDDSGPSGAPAAAPRMTRSQQKVARKSATSSASSG